MIETLLGFAFTGNATNNSTTIVQLSSSYQVHNSSDRNKGIRIYAGNKQITVHGLSYRLGSLNHNPTTSDAFLALPCSTQRLSEYIYYGLTYADTSERESQLLIVACEDNTAVNVGFQTILLNKMETYLLESTGNLTGTVAVSNNPISFFAGHRCTFVPTNVRACDHLIQQLPDTSTWGTRFLSASFAGRNSGEIYRVLASQPSTTVTFTCSTLSQPSTYTLPSAGSWVEITTSNNSFCSIVSNNPVLLAQFALGGTIDGYGDPFMVVVPAIDQYSNNYYIPLFHQFSTNYVSIFVSPEHYQPEHIYVDDVSLQDSNWTAIYCPSNTTCGYSAYANLSAGDYRIYHTNKLATIGVIAYGFGWYVSYGYPGGLQSAVMQGMLHGSIVYLKGQETRVEYPQIKCMILPKYTTEILKNVEVSREKNVIF